MHSAMSTTTCSTNEKSHDRKHRKLSIKILVSESQQYVQNLTTNTLHKDVKVRYIHLVHVEIL